MTSIEADTVLRGIGNRDRQQINDRVEGLQTFRQSLLQAGANGPAFADYDAAVNRLVGLNKLSATEVSADGAALSKGERFDLLAQTDKARDLGVEAFRELESGDTLCRCGETDATAAATTTAEAATSEADAAGSTAGDEECTAADAAADAAASANATPAVKEATTTATAKPATTTTETTKDGSAATGDAAECKTERNPEGVYKDSTTSLADVAKGGKVLSQGEKGAGVTEAQTLLRQLKGEDGKAKYDLGSSGEKCDGVDGYLGPKTAAALEQFKTDHGLKSDGKGTIDAETAALLKKVAGDGGTATNAASGDAAGTNGTDGTKAEATGKASAKDATAKSELPARSEPTTGEKVLAGASVGAMAAGKNLQSVKVTGPSTPKVRTSASKAVVPSSGGAVSNANPNLRTIHVPTAGQALAGRALRGAGIVGAAYNAVQDGKALGEAAGQDTVRGDGKHTELIKESSKVAGHWALAALGAKGAAAVATPFALATGPAAPFIIGAAGLVGGTVGYFAGDKAGAAFGEFAAK